MLVFVVVIGAAVCVVGLFFAFVGLRMWVKGESEFRGTCASQSPFLNKTGEACSYCGKPLPASGTLCEQQKQT